MPESTTSTKRLCTAFRWYSVHDTKNSRKPPTLFSVAEDSATPTEPHRLHTRPPLDRHRLPRQGRTGRRRLRSQPARSHRPDMERRHRAAVVLPTPIPIPKATLLTQKPIKNHLRQSVYSLKVLSFGEKSLTLHRKIEFINHKNRKMSEIGSRVKAIIVDKLGVDENEVTETCKLPPPHRISVGGFLP